MPKDWTSYHWRDGTIIRLGKKCKRLFYIQQTWLAVIMETGYQFSEKLLYAANSK